MLKSVEQVKKAVDNKPFITTYEAVGGWKAVHIWWNPEGFWEPYDTGFGYYASEADAIREALAWAEQEELEYKPRVPVAA